MASPAEGFLPQQHSAPRKGRRPPSKWWAVPSIVAWSVQACRSAVQHGVCGYVEQAAFGVLPAFQLSSRLSPRPASQRRPPTVLRVVGRHLLRRESGGISEESMQRLHLRAPGWQAALCAPPAKEIARIRFLSTHASQHGAPFQYFKEGRQGRPASAAAEQSQPHAGRAVCCAMGPQCAACPARAPRPRAPLRTLP